MPSRASRRSFSTIGASCLWGYAGGLPNFADVPEFRRSMRTPVVLAWSGGKDSSLALAALRSDPAFELVALMTTVTGDYERISMHGVRRSILEAQVGELGLPLVEATIPPAANNAVYEKAFASALELLR